jgi:hypothetical protein
MKSYAVLAKSDVAWQAFCACSSNFRFPYAQTGSTRYWRQRSFCPAAGLQWCGALALELGLNRLRRV